MCTEEIIVVVHQWPRGAWQTSRFPRGERPRSRVILVLAADSSIKTIRAGSSPPWPRFQRCRFARRRGGLARPHGAAV